MGEIDRKYFDENGNYLDGPHYGEDCPKGKVQVQFVGCDPKERFSPYGWKPVDSAFIEVYVDGRRFTIDIGNITSPSGKEERGINIVTSPDIEVNHHSLNAVSMTFKE